MLKRYDWREPPVLAEVFDRHRDEINKKTGRAANVKGRTAEERTLMAVELISTNISWVLGGRLATKKEDARGIDVVAETPIGPLYIQVKSSHCGAHRYKRKRRKARVIIVIIEPEMSDVKIREKVTGALHVQRKHILGLRLKSARARKQKARLS